MDGVHPTSLVNSLIQKVCVRPPPAPPAEPTGPPVTAQCGMIITESTILVNDVTGCTGEGLVIGAPNIVIDLNGHKVASSLLLEAGQEQGFFPGIRNPGRSAAAC